MTVKELISGVSAFPDDMEVVDIHMENITNVRSGTWTHTNYPYNLPDKDVVVIE